MLNRWNQSTTQNTEKFLIKKVECTWFRFKIEYKIQQQSNSTKRTRDTQLACEWCQSPEIGRCNIILIYKTRGIPYLSKKVLSGIRTPKFGFLKPEVTLCNLQIHVTDQCLQMLAYCRVVSLGLGIFYKVHRMFQQLRTNEVHPLDLF